MGVVDLAQSLVGKVRYVFGADNIEGGVGDCSSFTQYVYKQNGVNIGRDTTTQLSNVTKVSRENLQAGDLVFFQGTYRSGVSHVGIYIGDGNFIHNSSSDGVTINNLNESYYTKHWLTGGRVSGVNVGTLSTSNTGTINTGIGDTISDWLGINKIMKNVGVVVIIALCLIGGVLFFLGAWDIDIKPI